MNFDDSGSRPDSAGSEADLEIDARGLLCPLPLVKLGEGLRSASPGQIVFLQADDPQTEQDLRLWARSQPHEVLALEREGRLCRAWVRKAGNAGEGGS